MKKKAAAKGITARKVSAFRCAAISNLDVVKDYIAERLDVVHQRKHLEAMCLLAKTLQPLVRDLSFDTKTQDAQESEWEVTVYATSARGTRHAIAYFVMKPGDQHPKARRGQLLIGSKEIQALLRASGVSGPKRRFQQLKDWSRRYCAFKHENQGISLDLNARARSYVLRELCAQLAKALST